MKNLIFTIFLLVLCGNIFAQDPSFFESFQPSGLTYNYGAGGYALPSVGTINILMVFAEFKDDMFETNNVRWVKGQNPANMNNWVDQTWSTNPTQGSLTHYFNDMSGNKLKITGKEIHVIAPHTRWQYYNMTPMKKRAAIQKEIIQKIDSTEDFADYDNWGLISNYKHRNEPNGRVDMIIFVWRNTYQDSAKYASPLSLSFDNNYGDLGGGSLYPVDDSLRYVNPNSFGSGVTIRGYLQTGTTKDPFRLVTHEFAHYLLGWNDMHNGSGFWGMLSDWGVRSCVANAFERYQLNWIDDVAGYYTVDATSSNVVTYTKILGDLVTTRKAMRIIANTSTREYFYIENHTGTSYWETHTPFAQNPNVINGYIEPGIYIIRQKGMSNSTTQLSKMLIPADGRYNWTVDRPIVNPYDVSRVLPVWVKGEPNRTSGYHTLEMVPHNYDDEPDIENPAAISFGIKSTPPYWESISEINGDVYDAFKMGYKTVFSPWSNPNNQLQDTTTLDFSMELYSLYSSGTYWLKFYMNNPAGSSPDKPENIKVTSSATLHPHLTWDANSESDMVGYKIYKKITAEWGWQYLATVTTNSYDDLSESYNFNGDGSHPVWYRVTAYDNQAKESLPSKEIQTTVNGAYLEKSTNNENNLSFDYLLQQNYPNPFNPTTNINYQLKEKGHVSLMVYDILGKVVATLVNTIQEQGEHSVTFNANNLPSGLYIYSLKVNDYKQNKKMLLIK
ncbi:MAG: T9SS type A sorting domain-containing protein [bacterium]